MAYHTPVLLEEVVNQLQPRRGGLYVDCTVGGGGHAREILRASGPEGQLIGLDWDDEAIAASRERLGEFGARVQLVRASYVEMERVLMSLRVAAVDGVMFDLGVSSRQFDEPTRGFSFLREGPLDMRMSHQLGATARDVLRKASLEELAKIFRLYGEERRARAIAHEIVAERERTSIETTTQLARLVERVLGPKHGAIHPATRVFQALRIAVNDELANLKRGLEVSTQFLKSGARLAVISFHSLEDRIVKQFFVEKSAGCVCPPQLPVCACGRKAVLRIVTKKPVTAVNRKCAATRAPVARSSAWPRRFSRRKEFCSGVGNPSGGRFQGGRPPEWICMMKRNRKREPLRFGTVTRSLVVCVCVAVSGLCYVWQKNAIYRLGDEIKKRETALASAQKRNLMLAAKLAHLESPVELEETCQQYNLSLVSPKENQVVRLYEPGPEWDVQMANAPLAPQLAQARLQLRNSQPKTLVNQ